MKYVGSKNRIAKYILPIMLKDRKENQYWVEPFVGGGNMIDKVEGSRIGSDISENTINALSFIINSSNTIPDLISEDDYLNMSKIKSSDGYSSFVGYAMSYAGKLWGGYRRDKAGTKGNIINMLNQTTRSKNSAIKQAKLLKGVELKVCNYYELDIPDNSIIYCDPPYENTTRYSVKFDHIKFWEWCRLMAMSGHTLYISEYNAPNDFECIWSKEICSSLTKNTGSKKGIEKLFKYKGN